VILRHLQYPPVFSLLRHFCAIGSSTWRKQLAQIRQRGPSQYQARVRLHGHPEQTKTFSKKQDAIAWANEIERFVLQGLASKMREADKVSTAFA
jgi:hypothetical protein